MRAIFQSLGICLLITVAMSCTREDIFDYLKEQDNPGKQFQAKLDGANEVPAVDTRATGQVVFTLSKDGKSMRFKVTVNTLEDFLAAHIHIGVPGENGPVVAFLVPIEAYPFKEFINNPLFPGITNGLLGEGVLTADHLIGPFEGKTIIDLANEIEKGNAYVNLHTSEYPDGEIRGNL